MRYTNRLNLPETIVKAVESHGHRSSGFSVTQLLKGATEIALERMYPDRLEMDVSEAVNALFGTAVHKVLEWEDEDHLLKEHHMEQEVFAGFKVSGVADLLDMALRQVVDYKTCAVWKVIYKDFDDWREQLKGYLWLWHMESGELWRDGRIVAFLKDWSQTEAKRDPSYPQSPVLTFRFQYSEEEIFGVPETWTEKIVEVLQKLVTQDWGCCSEKERWAKPTTYALMKEGRKSAVRVYDSEAEAMDAKGDDPKLYIEVRKGRDVKCDDYCVAGKCGLCPYRNSKEGA